jgi:uncharacterized protein (TIGR03000 family)
MGCTGAAPATKPATTPEKKKETVPAPKPGEAGLSVPATIVVSLPAEAKLTVDGAATRSTTSTRMFSSPALERGKDYFYTMTAEVVRDGKTLSKTEKVTIRAGEETRVSLDFPETTLAQR